MGIVVKQTSKNIITISIALLIGGINTLYFYPEFLRDKYYGLVISNIKSFTTLDVSWCSTHNN
jgi:hypothetical protein